MSSLLLIVFVLLKLALAYINETNKLEILKDYGPKTLPKIRWVHIPRTGSGFAVTVLRYACDEPAYTSAMYGSQKKRQVDCESILNSNSFYKPIPLMYEENQYAVVMFRNPTDRFASQLRWMRSMVKFVASYGVATEDIAPLLNTLNVVPTADSLNTSNPCYFARASSTLLRSCRYLVASHFPGLRGCMTKMVLGKQCSERYALTSADLEEAKRIVRSEIAFVGIVERWKESVRLFHSMHGGPLYNEELFLKVRESPPAIENVRKVLMRSLFDYFDEELYATALEVFERQKERIYEKIEATGTDVM